jgi:hypothetical protein
MSQAEKITLIHLKKSAVVPIRALAKGLKLIYRGLWLVLACLLILALPAAGQDAASQIKAEANRLQQSLKDKPVSFPDIPNANAMLSGILDSAEKSLDAGWVYLSLEQLVQAIEALQGARAMADKDDAAKSTVPGFEAEWERVSRDVATLNQKARERNWGDAQAALRAFSETAQAKTVPLLESGRGFAIALGPKEGYVYLGQAQGEAEFAKFSASLDLPRKASPYPLRSILPELQNLQEKAIAAYRPPRSIKLHPTFIVLNSALKLAQELDAERFYAGALYQYLEAVRQYGLLDAVAPGTARKSDLGNAIGRMQKQLDASGCDDSIARIYLERAESQLRHADGSAPSEDDWKSAAVVIDQVLPAYFAAKNPPPALARASGGAVDITLVRWPYT